MNDHSKPLSALQKFRKKYPRVDYFPDVLANDAIVRMRQVQPGKSTREVIDALVIAGAKAMFPESGDGDSGNASLHHHN